MNLGKILKAAKLVIKVAAAAPAVIATVKAVIAKPKRLREDEAGA
jgi:hypothetical protein